jgi:chromosome partitioning protein
MKRPRIISVVNQKGGVSKTTTTANLGAGLALKGYKVLLIDLDSQCNLTQSLVGDIGQGQREIAHCILEETSLAGVILPTKTQNLFLTPAGEEMSDVDINLVGVTARESVLKRCLAKTDLSSFDFVLIDTAPYISLVTVNALVASSHYLIPTTAEYLPVRGIERLQANVQKFSELLNPELSFLGAVITQYDTRKAITGQVEELLKEELGADLLNTRVRINTKFSSSPIEQQTIYQYENDGQGKGTEDYSSLTTEVLERLGLTNRVEVANG